jgi:hypothetical protein
MYGPTGTGKTFTMMGNQKRPDEAGRMSTPSKGGFHQEASSRASKPEFNTPSKRVSHLRHQHSSHKKSDKKASVSKNDERERSLSKGKASTARMSHDDAGSETLKTHPDNHQGVLVLALKDIFHTISQVCLVLL